MHNDNCPACGNDENNTLLGTLGHLDHYRCRDCGWLFNTEAESEEFEEAELEMV